MSDENRGFSPHSDKAATVSTQMMIAVVIFLFLVVFLIFLFYLYAKRCMGAHPALRHRGSSSFLFAAAADVVPLPRRGLDVDILNSLPVTAFKAADFKEGGMECSVCLSEVADGEKVRLLSKCNHGFHVGCIDTWFRSHTTCPLCRAAVEIPDAGPGTDAVPVFPTNVLFWGSQDGVGGRAAREENPSLSGVPGRRPGGMLVIDIPRRAMEGFLPSPMSSLPSSRFATAETNTPKTPVEEMKTPRSGRVKSLRRLLSRGKRVASSSRSPRGGDIERGGAVGGGAAGEGSSSLAPKTPTC